MAVPVEKPEHFTTDTPTGKLIRQVLGAVAEVEKARTLELGVDPGATGPDKYGTKGPRFGLLAGRKDLVSQIRAKGFEFGMEARQMLYPAVVRTLEQYDPTRVRALNRDHKTDCQRAACSSRQPAA